MSKWDKLFNWLNDMRLAIAPDERVRDKKDRAYREAQVSLIDCVFNEMQHLDEKDEHPLINIQTVINDLNEINEALWEIDIPFPICPEYKEHHEQIQSIMKLVREKADKWEKVRE